MSASYRRELGALEALAAPRKPQPRTEYRAAARLSAVLSDAPDARVRVLLRRAARVLPVVWAKRRIGPIVLDLQWCSQHHSSGACYLVGSLEGGHRANRLLSDPVVGGTRLLPRLDQS